jgi:hypothetical protein
MIWRRRSNLSAHATECALRNERASWTELSSLLPRTTFERVDRGPAHARLRCAMRKRAPDCGPDPIFVRDRCLQVQRQCSRFVPRRSSGSVECRYPVAREALGALNPSAQHSTI